MTTPARTILTSSVDLGGAFSRKEQEMTMPTTTFVKVPYGDADEEDGTADLHSTASATEVTVLEAADASKTLLSAKPRRCPIIFAILVVILLAAGSAVVICYLMRDGAHGMSSRNVSPLDNAYGGCDDSKMMSLPQQFPEVVGMQAETAKEQIVEETDHCYDVKIYAYDSMVTTDYSECRVRIFAFPNGTVAEVPRVG